MKMVHMIVNTFNTSTMMEPIFLINNIKCQKWQAIKIYLIPMCNPNKGQRFTTMFTNNQKHKESRIYILPKRVNTQPIYVNLYWSHYIKKITNKAISPLNIFDQCVHHFQHWKDSWVTKNQLQITRQIQVLCNKFFFWRIDVHLDNEWFVLP